MTAADHANTVRHALEEQVFGSVYRKEVLAHLDALQAQAEATAKMTRHVESLMDDVESLMDERDRLAEELDDAADALRRIADGTWTATTGDSISPREYARAALARTEQA